MLLIRSSSLAYTYTQFTLSHDETVPAITIFASCSSSLALILSTTLLFFLPLDWLVSQLLRVLGRHATPVLSVSVNPVSGHALTLSCAELRIYSINGAVVGTAKIGTDPFKVPPFPPSLFVTPEKYKDASNSPPRRVNSTGKEKEKDRVKVPDSTPPLPAPPSSWGRVVVAPPCSAWLDGIVAVTGHDSGLVSFWRLQSIAGYEKSGRQLVASPLTLSAAQYSNQISSVPQPLSHPKRKSTSLPHTHAHTHTHSSSITVLRLCPIVSSKSKDPSEKSPLGGPVDLLIGDEKGYISAWTVLKLDHLSPLELSQIGSLKAPPSRDLPTSNTSTSATLAGAANAFSPLGASGLLKLLGAGGLGSSNAHTHTQHHNQHETASALAARIQEIEDLSNDDNMEEFF